jgi:threonine dehydrogenase-like Zn-dependent dehydrogenase
MRYVDVFDEAIGLVSAGRINLQPFIKTVFPLDQSANALHHAGDKSSAGKIQIEI